jgi:hypothetical protein
MIYASFSSIVVIHSARQFIKAECLPREEHRTPAENRMVRTIRASLRLGKAVIVLNFNGDVAYHCKPALPDVQWELIPFNFKA